MKLSKEQAAKIKKLDIVKATRKAREESSHLLNDQDLSPFPLLFPASYPT